VQIQSLDLKRQESALGLLHRPKIPEPMTTMMNFYITVQKEAGNESPVVCWGCKYYIYINYL
jgi:hypothetical protein